MAPKNESGATSRGPRIRTNFAIANRGLSLADMRNALLAHPETGMERLADIVERGEMRLGGPWRLQDLAHACDGVTVQARQPDPFADGQTRAVTADAFPLAMGNLAIAAINDAREMQKSVGSQLVTEMDHPSSDYMTMMGVLISAGESFKRRTETEEYPLIGASQERYDLLISDNGFRIEISAKAIRQNDHFNVIERVNQAGQIMEEDVEVETLKAVTDHYGSKGTPAEPYVLRLNKTATSLFSATANTPGTRVPSGTRVQNARFQDTTDLEAVRSHLAGILNERGKRRGMPWSEAKLFIPDALVGVVGSLLRSEYIPGVFNEVNPFGPRGDWRLRPEQIITTPKLDDLSTSAYYAGWPQRQFVRAWGVRMDMMALAGSTEKLLTHGIAWQGRLAWSMGVGARDYSLWHQFLAGTTAPADE